MAKERDFLKHLSDSLLQNQKDFKTQLDAARAEAAGKEEAVKDLEEQLRDVMFALEAQRVVEASGGASELQGATILPLPERAAKSTRRRK